jgi:hypothetical protein
MNNKIIPALGLVILVSTTTTIANTPSSASVDKVDIHKELSNPPYIGVSFSMGDADIIMVPDRWLTEPELPYATQDFIANLNSSKVSK